MVGMRIGLLHPGEMGASVGAAAMAVGHQVRWVAAGRSAASHSRAAAAGLVDAGRLAELLAWSELVVSIVPPHAAAAVAEQVAGHSYARCYVDANAVAPDAARGIAAVIAGGGGELVDGAIIGGPVGSPGGTRLYLAGGSAAAVAAAFAGSALATVVLPGPVGAASAVKACYAGWSKGTAALVLALRALARVEGVEAALLAELAGSLPDLPGDTERAARGAAGKGWRWAGEMEQIAAALAARDLPAGFHSAAAEVYRRVGRPPDGTVDTVVDLINQPR
jgi:3-hydroxyisobutyrate dehydrogenase-like beta-hydroxyacid dehydrogenase